ncbi:MAG TPA: zeta toxin family protein [Ohtaekwangia sp.]|uniref:zeta toxin family protein n=1 Tax=Ohtaekwangia sp. TaxID=2066019 RepID=UPI002F94B7C6
MIIFGDEEQTGFSSLYYKARHQKYNLIIPKIGADPDDIIPYCEGLKNAGYKVHLSLVYLPKEKSTVRALKRFHETKRYVPLSLIFDVYGSNPSLTYFMLKNRQPYYIDSYGIINTDVSKNESFYCTDILGKNPAGLFRKREKVLI